MPGYTSSEESEDSRRPPKQSPEKLGESKQKHKRTKSMTPQQSISRTWRRFSRHQSNNGLAIIPFDPVPPPVNTGRFNRLLSEDYGRAAAECRLKVEKIVKECKRVNMRYRDPDWDLVSLAVLQLTRTPFADCSVRIGILNTRKVTA